MKRMSKAVELARDNQKLLDDAPTKVRQMAREIHENAYNLCKLHWLGLVAVKPAAEPILDNLNYWLRKFIVVTSTGPYWTTQKTGDVDGDSFHFPVGGR